MAAFPLQPANPRNPIWLESKLSSTYRDRLELSRTLQDIKQWNEIQRILNANSKDIRSIATILNDCPQWARKLAFTQLEIRSPDIYSKCLDAISEFQINKDILDPDNDFPFVATARF